MSFVSKGEKKMHNMTKKAGGGADRGASKDSFGKKGERKMRNEAPRSKDRASEPVSEDAMDVTPGAEKVVNSEYDPASGKRAKSVADLRSAYKKINEKSMAGEASPEGSEGGQDGKHSSSKNDTNFMKAGQSEMDKKSMKKPRGLASQEDPEMDDPMDEDLEDNELTKQGMTPKGQSRAKSKKLKSIRQLVKDSLDDVME